MPSETIRTHRSSPLRPAPAIAAACALCLAAPVAAQKEDRAMTTPVASKMLSYVSHTALVNWTKLGYRITDLEVLRTNPWRYSAALVKNTGAYAKGWWWYVNVDLSSLISRVVKNRARLTDLEVWYSGGKRRFAALMERNTGTNASSWTWTSGSTISGLLNIASSRKMRPIDVEEYRTPFGTTRYAAVFLDNTGSSFKPYKWYFNATTSFIASRLKSNRMRLYDLDRRSNGRFNCIMVRDKVRWYYYYNVTASFVQNKESTLKLRTIDVRRRSNGRVDVVMLSNGTPGSFKPFGIGCKNSEGKLPVHYATGTPEIGKQISYRVKGWSAGKFNKALLLIGASNTKWGLFNLPYPMLLLGAPGCYLRVEPAVIKETNLHFGTAWVYLTLQNNPAFIGQKLHTQYLVFDAGVNAGGYVMSNGLTTTIGSK